MLYLLLVLAVFAIVLVVARRRGWPLSWSLNKPDTPLPWRETPVWLKVLIVVAVIGWIVTLIVMLIAGEIETEALRQPSSPAAVYTHAHNVKGVIRFFTDGQEAVYQIVKPFEVPSWAVTALLFCIVGWFQQRRSEARKQARLRKLLGSGE
jgi:hypothetical protein